MYAYCLVHVPCASTKFMMCHRIGLIPISIPSPISISFTIHMLYEYDAITHSI